LKLVVWLTRIAGIAGLALGMVWNARVAVADLLAARNQPTATRRAMRFDPGNAAYPAQLGEELEITDPSAAQTFFERAVRLDPYDASAWVDLGLQYEERGDIPHAESALLRAAAVDATWIPDWSLANFYYRHQRWDDFWIWARKATQMVPEDATPLFRLAWYAASDEPEIQARLGITRPEVQRRFLWFLMSLGDATAVYQWGTGTLAMGGPDTADDVLSACDWLIQRRRLDLALPLWNGLASRHSIPFARLQAGEDEAVTNGVFAHQPLSRGFDWHLAQLDGISNFLNSNPSALGFEFSGREAESAVLMTEIVPVEPQRPYTLRIESIAAQIPPNSGIKMLVEDSVSTQVVAQVELADGDRIACFITPPGMGFATLAFEYQRQPGTVPPEGRIELRKVSLLPGLVPGCIQPSGSPH